MNAAQNPRLALASAHLYCATNQGDRVVPREFVHRENTSEIQAKLRNLYPAQDRIRSGVEVDPHHNSLILRAATSQDLYLTGVKLFLNLKRNHLGHCVSLGLQ